MGLTASLWVVGLLTVGAFAARRWWFPQPINDHALQFDSWFGLNLWVLGAAFLLVQLALGWLIWRYRDRGQTARHSHGSTRLEFLWTSITLAIFLAAAFGGLGLWTTPRLSAGAASAVNALRIEALAKQFAWNFRYAGPDGRFGRTGVQWMNDASGNPFGIDERDPAGADDITSSALRVPAGRPIELTLRSPDVIHNFFVRELRMKQDVVPGMEIPVRFQADRAGEYEIACSELCGLGHHQMRSVLLVLTPEAFETWLAEQRR